MGLFLAKQYIIEEEKVAEEFVASQVGEVGEVGEVADVPLNRTWVERLVSITGYK